MASFSWSWCFLEDIRMAHFFEPLSIWDHLCYFHTWMTSWLAQRSVFKLLIENFNGGESDLLTVLPAIHSCAGLDDREIWFKRVIFSPTSSTPKSVEIPPHSGPWRSPLSNGQWSHKFPYFWVPSQVFQRTVQRRSTEEALGSTVTLAPNAGRRRVHQLALSPWGHRQWLLRCGLFHLH